MFQDTYTKLNAADTEKILAKTAASFDGVAFNPANTIVMERTLDFYPGFKFYDMADHTNNPTLRRFVLIKKDNVIVLDFTNTPIYEENK